ncbi:MAG: AmmeMemoRadiSam system protein B [Dehalococcoidia bacterium]
MERHPLVIWEFYPGSADSLRTELDRLMDMTAPKEKVVGLVTPHSGLWFSGRVAGATYSRVKMKDTFVIIGPHHTKWGAPFSIMAEGTWITPLGHVEIDTQLSKAIVSLSSHLENDIAAHVFEHSIEVQLPFLQHLKEDIKIVPIVLASASEQVYKEIGKSIAQAVKELGQEVVIVAASDMTHWEPNDSVRSKDSKAIESILRLDEHEFLERVKELDITMSGDGPVVSMICAAKELGSTEGELVHYLTSGDVLGNFDSVVGYAGIILKR